jgi:hypothetical protein
MGVVRVRRSRQQVEEVIVSVECDRCGRECARPTVGLGCTAPFYARVLARPDDNGNEPHVESEPVLCHDCADAFAEWVLEPGAWKT